MKNEGWLGPSHKKTNWYPDSLWNRLEEFARGKQSVSSLIRMLLDEGLRKRKS
jgi:hypothetical protein